MSKAVFNVALKGFSLSCLAFMCIYVTAQALPANAINALDRACANEKKG